MMKRRKTTGRESSRLSRFQTSGANVSLSPSRSMLQPRLGYFMILVLIGAGLFTTRSIDILSENVGEIHEGSTISQDKGLNKYNILCTTTERQILWGSYQIRCRDLKTWADRCAKDVQIYLYSHEETKYFSNNITFDATVSIKTPFYRPGTKFGKLYLDVVDNYDVTERKVHPTIDVIVQNIYHANDIFPNRNHHVVEHWYNSYPQDMMSEKPVFEIPSINEVDTLNMATVWTNKQEPCPTLHPTPNVNYQCIDEIYTIATWYDKYFDLSIPGRRESIEKTLKDPLTGPGGLYYELFWMYDVLVIPAKMAFKPKLRYGNVQRAVSQMRSGVPVLLEIYGEVLEEFMDMYNYTCAFVRSSSTTNLTLGKGRRYWTFEEAAQAMKSKTLREQCQKEGSRIVQDYSPRAIAQKQLRALGYQGTFNCNG